MRKNVFLILLIALVAGIIYANHDPLPEGGITFHQGTVQEAFELAKKENKPIFIDVYAVWCGPCRLLKQYTFTDKAVGEYFNANFINLAIDGEKGEGIGVARSLSVRAYPTLAVVSPDGNILIKTEGFYQPEQLLDFGKQALEQHSNAKPEAKE
jgi:thiol:disulfide interchange protein